MSSETTTQQFGAQLDTEMAAINQKIRDGEISPSDLLKLRTLITSLDGSQLATEQINSLKASCVFAITHSLNLMRRLDIHNLNSLSWQVLDELRKQCEATEGAAAKTLLRPPRRLS